MEYRILEVVYKSATMTKYKVVGDGFKSFQAVWFAVYDEVGRRMLADHTGVIDFVFERIELDQGSTIIGNYRIDDRSLPLDQLAMPI